MDSGEQPMTDLTDQQIKNRRAAIIMASIALALPALAVSFHVIREGRYEPAQWAQLEMAVFAVSWGLSLLVGWKANYETLFGDQSIYVDEPEVGDD